MNNLVFEGIRWTNLGRFANSKIGRLTIIVPLLGYLFVFNQSIRQYLEPLVGTHLEVQNAKIFRFRLEILYIGLSIFGAGSGLFALVAPSPFKLHTGYSGFVDFKMKYSTNRSVAASLENSLKRLKDMEGNGFCPPRVFTARDRLLDVWFGQTVEDVNCLTPLQLNSNNIRAACLSAVKSNFVEPIDVYRLEFMSQNYDYPKVRVFCFCLLAVGTLIALLPSLHAFYLALASVFANLH